MILPDLFPIITFYSSPRVHDRFGCCVTPFVLVIILKELNEICHLFIIILHVKSRAFCLAHFDLSYKEPQSSIEQCAICTVQWCCIRSQKNLGSGAAFGGGNRLHIIYKVLECMAIADCHL